MLADPDSLAALDEHGTQASWKQIKHAAERASGALADLGMRAGEVVCWQLPTRIGSKVLMFALARLGVIQCPLLPTYRAREVSFIVRQANARMLIVPGTWGGFDHADMADGIAAHLEREGRDLRVLVADSDLPEADSWTEPAPAAPDDVRWLYYTSGTTGEPKGARHSDATIHAAARAMNERFAITRDDRNAIVFPFTHIGGGAWVFSAVSIGYPTLFLERFDPPSTIPLLQQHEVTIVGSGTPFHMAYLAAQRAMPAGEVLLPSARIFVGGGAPKPPQLHYDMKREMGRDTGIVSGYGLTEAPLVVLASPSDDDVALAHTEGRAAPGVELTVCDAEGNAVAPGETGELRIRAPQLMKGYVDTALDGEAFDSAGRFRTGDLARIDEAGMVTIAGRIKDLIIRNMENISAKEVEDTLFRHPEVADAAVIGVPDPRTGERICAVIVPTPGAAPTLDALAAFCRQNGLMKQKVPERVELVAELPRNPAGKVLKPQLREQFAGGAQPSS
ncbi:class I adenylate-forming enzyme family protein [Humibacter sp.]|uniref:class I adenylate-forming enzyme family protein n=1 Tax=Humibacter sp. TaxID=1940291 RepID=UPI002C91E216|nr:AMP-binding protein [Humibacter sp.]HVX09180.1 AMP-binding protein [Humibacter sp.]